MNQTRDFRINFRLTKKEHMMLKRRAKNHKMLISDYLRFLINEDKL